MPSLIVKIEIIVCEILPIGLTPTSYVKFLIAYTCAIPTATLPTPHRSSSLPGAYLS